MNCSSSSDLELSQLIFGEPFCFTADLSQASEEETTEKELIQKHYLGCLTPREAEQSLKNTGSLALYHQDSSTTMQVYLNLSMYLIYKTAKGRCKRFAVENVHLGQRIFYRVQGNPHSHKFASLGHLVRFYTTYYLCSEDKIDAMPSILSFFSIDLLSY